MPLKHQVCAVTKRLYLGPFLTPDRAVYLRGLGVTHALNVGEAPSVVTPASCGFAEIRDLAIVDWARIPDDVAIECLEQLHQMLRSNDSKVYVHCIAGQNRSPTVVWLYLIACGMPRDEAKAIVEAASPDSVPGHKTLADARLALLVEEYGRTHFQPLEDNDTLSLA
jgi:hypothetical protein